MHRGLIANISWNDKGWTFPKPNPRAGHSYPRKNPGHESLNFVFNKPDIDSGEWIHGFFQRAKEPKEFENGGVAIFYSRDTDDNGKGKIVGAYGGAEIFDTVRHLGWKEFKEGEYMTNIRARPELSLRFPIYLISNRYRVSESRFVGQVNFRYDDKNLVVDILSDEIRECEKAGKYPNELVTLHRIYEYFTGKKYSAKPTPEELEKEQQERELAEAKKLSGLSVEELNKQISIFEKTGGLLGEDQAQPAVVNTFPRDPKLSALIKARNNYTCQICEKPSFEGKGGHNYVETHHVIPRGAKGADDPRNIITACPTCHRKFDRGNNRTKVEVYRILKKKKLFSDFDTLRKIGEISDEVYAGIMAS